MPLDTTTTQDAGTLMRPALLVRTARRVAQGYCPARDVPPALPGPSDSPIRVRLAQAEAHCEAARLAHAPGYRPARHVLLLGALMAETMPGQENASGSAALRCATKSCSASSIAGSIGGAS